MRKDLKLIGAAMERKAILRKIRTEKRQTGNQYEIDILNLLDTWILDRDKRYSKRKGGLGK